MFSRYKVIEFDPEEISTENDIQEYLDDFETLADELSDGLADYLTAISSFSSMLDTLAPNSPEHNKVEKIFGDVQKLDNELSSVWNDVTGELSTL